MIKSIYNKSIITGKVQLIGFEQKATHFGMVGFLLIAPIMFPVFHLIDWIQSKPTPFHKEEILLIIIPFVLSVFLYWFQKERLKFQIVYTKLDHNQIHDIILDVAEKLKWRIISHTGQVYVAITTPGFLSGSWGERITILIDNDRVFVNSICDPNKHPSIASWGGNGLNEDTLISEIKNRSVSCNVTEDSSLRSE